MDGKSLVQSEVQNAVPSVGMSVVQNITISGDDGSADITFNISIPDSPLSDILLEAFYLDLENDTITEDTEYVIQDNTVYIMADKNKMNKFKKLLME